MKGYWINHVVDIKDPERFGAYAEASMPLLQGDNKYGARLALFGPVLATLLGDPVQYAAVAEFDNAQAAIDFWDDPDYVAARARMGPRDDESAVVDRRVCCIEGEPLNVTPKQGFWLNNVHEIIDEAAFFNYAEASMPHFTCVSPGRSYISTLASRRSNRRPPSASTASARRRESTTRPNTGPRWPPGAWKRARATSSTAPSARSRW